MLNLRLNSLKRLILFFLILISNLIFSDNVQAQNKGKIKTVVIDAGHGGKDPGALGKGKGIHEKHIVLAVAKKMGDKIKERYPDVKVIYTRSNDTFIGLHERAMVARRNNADLFISIHCNGSSSTEAKGTSVHILGQNSNNKKNKTDYFERNMSVAQRENSVIVLEDDYQTKYAGFNPNSPESYIIFSLLQNMHQEQSIKYAAHVQGQFAKGPITVNRGVKQGGLLALAFSSVITITSVPTISNTLISSAKINTRF